MCECILIKTRSRYTMMKLQKCISRLDLGSQSMTIFWSMEVGWYGFGWIWKTKQWDGSSLLYRGWQWVRWIPRRLPTVTFHTLISHSWFMSLRFSGCKGEVLYSKFKRWVDHHRYLVEDQVERIRNLQVITTCYSINGYIYMLSSEMSQALNASKIFRKQINH